MLNVCIVDENEASRQHIAGLIENFCCNNNIGCETDVISATALLRPDVWEDCAYDLAIFNLSGVMNREQLMQYSVNVRKRNQKTKMIYISDDLVGSLDIFDYNPDYFIFKPQLDFRLIPALEHIFGVEVKTKGSSLIISTKSAKVIIPEGSIIYLEHYQHDTIIVCEDRTVTCHEKLDSLLERLDSKSFVKCHCSFAVNLNYVREYRRTQLILSNSDVIPCSRANQQSVRTAILAHG